MCQNNCTLFVSDQFTVECCKLYQSFRQKRNKRLNTDQCKKCLINSIHLKTIIETYLVIACIFTAIVLFTRIVYSEKLFHPFIVTVTTACMSVCLHVCKYVRMSVCVCMCVCMHVFMYVCMYVCMYVSMYVFMYLCMHVCLHVCKYVCMYVCMYVMYVFMYTCIYTYICMYVCMYV